jgi:hypothetical protein
MSDINPKIGTKENSSTGNTVRNESNGINLPGFTITSSEIYENGPTGPNDKSVASLRSKWNIIDFFKKGMRFITGDVLFKSANFQIESKGDVKILVKGDHITKVKNGKVIVQNGEMTDVQIKAAQKIQEIYDEAEKAKKDAIKSTKGEMVPCETCAQEHLVNRKSGFGTRLFKVLRKLGTIPYFCYALDILENIYNATIAQFLDIITAQGLSGESTCGSKGCKNGMVESPQKKIEKGNDAAQAVYEKHINSGELAKQEDLLNTTDEVKTVNGDVTVNIGYPTSSKHTPYEEAGYKDGGTRFKKGKSMPQVFWQSGEGSIKNIVNTNPMPVKGNLGLNIAGSLLLKTGNNGMELLTSGHSHLAGGSILVAATEGDMIVTSANKTTIKGKLVEIDGDDRSGSGGVSIRAHSTKVQGALNVTGNISCMGAISCDGNLAASHIIGRSMRMQTAESGGSKSIGNQANWLGTCQEQLVADELLQKLQMLAMLDCLLSIGNIYKLVLETFDAIMGMTMIETVTTGYYIGYADVIGEGNLGYPVVSFGTSWGTIYNWKHNHSKTNEPHTHDYTTLKADMYDTLEDYGGARADASNIPTPATETCMGTKPGHKSLSGACGGGGGGFGFSDTNSRASKARRNRNSAFGIYGDDAYGDYDFVNTTPKTGTWKYDENGDITPKELVGLSIGFDCPADLDPVVPVTDINKDIRDC